jgi:hypothetical protein
MTSQYSIGKEPAQSGLPISALPPTSHQAGSLWQRMFNAWIDTYELSFRSGAVPFLLL